jgi:PmbA protein
MPWWVVSMPEYPDIHWLADAVIAEGGKVADEVEVFFAASKTVTAELRRSVVGEATEDVLWSMGIRTISDGRIGMSGTNDPSRWRECLDASVASGRLSTPQEWHGLPAAAEIRRDVPIFDPKLRVDVAVAADLLQELLDGATEYPAEVVGGSAALSQGTYLLANSNSIRYENKRTGAGVSLETIRGTSTGFEFDRSCFLDLDAREVGKMAAFYAVHSEKGEDIKSGTYDLILSPVALGQLLDQVVIPALSGRNVKAGRSYLADKLGEECMDAHLSLYDDPFARGLGSTAWDAEGVATRRIDFFRDGVLECFAYDLKTAYRYGEESTGSAVRSGAAGAPGIGVHNLVVDADRTDIGEAPAVFAHSLVGAHTANPVTGDFSVELSNPSWFEGGEFASPIRSAMLAGNIFAMLGDIGGLGKDTRVVGNIILPSVRFNNLRIIGK